METFYVTFTRYLPGICLLWSCLAYSQPRLVLPSGHAGAIRDVSFSPDGKWVVTGSFDQTARVWDAISGNLIFDLNAVDGMVVHAEYSPDGKKIMTLHFGGNNKVAVWDALNGNLLYTIRRQSHNKINFSVFTPDSRNIVTASHDYKLSVYEAEKGKLVKDFEGHDGFVISADFSADGDTLTTQGTDSLKISWDLTSGKRLKIISSIWDPEKETTAVTYSFDQNYAALLSRERNRLTVWDAGTGRQVIDTAGLGWVSKFAFSKDSKKLVTASPDQITRTWDLVSGTMISEMKGHTARAGLPVFSPAGSQLAQVSADAGIKIWDMEYGRLVNTLPGHTGKINSIQFSPDGKYLVSGSSDHTARVWDLESGHCVHTLNGHNEKVVSACFSPDGKKILTASGDGTARIWTTDKGTIVHVLKGHTKPLTTAVFSNDGRMVVTGSTDNTAIIWDASSGLLLHHLNAHKAQVNGVSFSPDGQKLSTASSDNTAIVWDVESGTRIAHMNGNEYTLDMRTAEFSPDGKYLLTNSLNGASRWHVLTGKKLNDSADLGANAIYSPDGNLIISRLNNQASVWQANPLKEIAVLNEHKALIFAHEISPDGYRVVTFAEDHSAKLWNAKTGKLLCSFYAVDSNDFIVQTKDGYYQSSQDAARLLHYVTKDLKTISFEQLDVKYNRPDKVLETIGCTDTALIRSYRKAWEKRIRKLGIDTTAFRDGFSVPEADFRNRDQLAYLQKDKTVLLRIHASDSVFNLDRFNIWVNEAPVFGHRGNDLRKLKRNEIDTTILITLSSGTNRIETSVTNANGTESFRVPLLLNYQPDSPETEMVYFVGIGIDRFKDEKYNLQFSTKDIRDLALALSQRYQQRIVIDTLFNHQVTVQNIAALKDRLRQSGVNDKVIISYSGHGILNNAFDYFLSTYDVNFSKPEINGLPYDVLENLLDSIPARKKLMFIDACHSGEVDKEDLITLNNAPDSLIKGLKPVAYKKEKGLGLKNSFELMQSLFVNVGKSTGATVISAAAGTQFALERNDLRNGVFTYCILKALQEKPVIPISELRRNVGVHVEEITRGLQKPTSRNENISVDWKL